MQGRARGGANSCPSLDTFPGVPLLMIIFKIFWTDRVLEHEKKQNRWSPPLVDTLWRKPLVLCTLLQVENAARTYV